MKRIVSLMLIALMLGAMTVSSVADVDPSYVQNRALMREGEDAEGPTVEDGMYLDEDTTSNAVGYLNADTLLVPDKTYRFPIMIGDGTDLNAVDIDTSLWTIRTSAKKGGSTVSTSVSKISGHQTFVIDVKAGWPTSKTDCEFEIRLTPKGTNNEAAKTLRVEFKTGYEEADDRIIDGLGQDDEIIVDPERPVYTKEQLEKIASVNNYRNVTFTSLDGDWTYVTNVSDKKAINMLYNYNGIADLLNKYPDHDFEFLAFPAGPAFSINGKMSVDVADYGENFENYHVYRFLSGNLTELKHTYNADDETITFNTSTLGRFVISDQKMETTDVEEPGGGNNGNNNSSGGGATNPDEDKGNPGTGAVA